VGRQTEKALTTTEKQLASFAAMRADAGDFDHRTFGGETDGAGRGFEGFRNRAARRLADRTAALAEKEHDDVVIGVIVHAGHEGVAALDSVHETVTAQKLERPVDGDGGGTSAIRQPLDNFVGAERLVTSQQCFEYVPTHTREPLPPLGAEFFCVGDCAAGAVAMIVARRREYCV